MSSGEQNLGALTSSHPAPQEPASTAASRWRRPEPWVILLWSTVVLLATVRLAGLASSPPGLHQDEAAIGYDAWAIAHHGVDQHGAVLPLFFESFGDFKSPLYVYLLAPFTWAFPLTPGVVRLPAALCGLASCALLAGTARRATGGPPAVTVLALLTAGLMPWLFLESRVGFEVVTLTLSLSAALWCLARAHTGGGCRWFLAAGAPLALAEYAYPTGRLMVALLLPALCVAHLWPRLPAWFRTRRPGEGAVQPPLQRVPAPAPEGWWTALLIPVAAYAAMALWALHHPGALTARFSALSILNDDPGPATALRRLAGNYLAHLNIPFLLLRGDSNPRHSTGLGGMILVATLPALMTGAVACWRHRDEALPCFALLGLLVAPIPASLTREGIPHGLRAAPMIPFLLLITSYGWQRLLPWLSRPSRQRSALAVLAMLQVGLYLGDLFVTYPARAEGSFDGGIGAAITAAHSLANGHQVLLSDSLGQPYAHALFQLRPAPGRDLDATMAMVASRQLPLASIRRTARHGDILVLAPADHPPPSARLLLVERTRAAWWSTMVAASVYRV
ncbi:MAG: ArnT family glycosyltransferase [Candidatus Dormibacteria bacterium]